MSMSTRPNPLTHDDIARHARQLWQDRGRPEGQDQELWLEAERQLKNGGEEAFAERAKAETAAESMVEHQITPAIPEKEAIQAALQKKQARAPQVPAQEAPKAKPAETGKPVWTGPHSR